MPTPPDHDPNSPQPDPNQPTPSGPRPPVHTAGAQAPPPPYGQQPSYGYAPPPPQPPQKSGGIFKKVGTYLALSAVSLLVLSIIINIYLGGILAAMTSGPSVQPYEQGNGDHSVTILPIEGMITAETAEFVREAVQSLNQNPPDALVLRVESGGGGVTASDQIWSYIDRFREKHAETKVIASFGSVAASGGYYVATPADYIFVEHTTITGSIGVLAQVPNLDQAMDKLGVEINTYVADGSPKKDLANNMFREWTEEDQAVIDRILASAYDRFVQVVYEGRESFFDSEQAVREQVATGRVFTASEAIDAQIVDELGYLDDAIRKAYLDAGGNPEANPSVQIIRKPQRFGLGSLIGAEYSVDLGSIDIRDIEPDRVRAWLNELQQPLISYRLNMD